jgi:hypothetical protein
MVFRMRQMETVDKVKRPMPLETSTGLATIRVVMGDMLKYLGCRMIARPGHRREIKWELARYFEFNGVEYRISHQYLIDYLEPVELHRLAVA